MSSKQSGKGKGAGAVALAKRHQAAAAVAARPPHVLQRYTARKIQRRGSILRSTPWSLEATVQTTHAFVDELARDIGAYVDSKRMRTVTLDAVNWALARRGYKRAFVRVRGGIVRHRVSKEEAAKLAVRKEKRADRKAERAKAKAAAAVEAAATEKKKKGTPGRPKKASAVAAAEPETVVDEAAEPDASAAAAAAADDDALVADE